MNFQEKQRIHLELVKRFISYAEKEMSYVTYFIDENIVFLLSPDDYAKLAGFDSSLTPNSFVFNMKKIELHNNYTIESQFNQIVGSEEEGFEYLTLKIYLDILKEEYGYFPKE